MGYSISNYTFIEGETGLIAFDAGSNVGMGWEALAMIRKITDKPIVAIIYLHRHYTGGAKVYVEEGGSKEVTVYGQIALPFLSANAAIGNVDVCGTWHYGSACVTGAFSSISRDLGGMRHRPLTTHDLWLGEIVACGHVKWNGGDLKTILITSFARRFEKKGHRTGIVFDSVRIVDVVPIKFVRVETTGCGVVDGHRPERVDGWLLRHQDVRAL